MEQFLLAKPKLDMALFPAKDDAGDRKQITAQAAITLLVWAEGYGLDAWQGHVCYMHGKPYVTEHGAVANALKYPEYGGFALTPVSPDDLERKGFSPGSWVWECTVRAKGGEMSFSAYGEVTEEEVQRLVADNPDKAQYLPIVKSPRKIAQARAIRRAHLLAFPLIRQVRERKEAEQ